MKLPKIRRPVLRTARINYRTLVRRLVTLSLLLLLVGSYLAYTRLYLTNERRFWMAINNSMSTPSVVKTVETGGTGNKSIKVTRYVYGSQAAQDEVSSVGFKNATSESNVTIETITTPSTQYVRYANIFSTEKTASGGAYNFESLKNVWAKQASTTSAEQINEKRLSYLQSQVTLVPFGNLTASARQAITAELKAKHAYEVDFINANTQADDSGTFISYSVRVHTKQYVTILRNYFKTAGLGDFPALDPTGYAEGARVNANILVNKKNNMVSGVSFNNQIESYGNYGVLKNVDLPVKTVSIDELQSKLQSAQ